jgi:signal transduction histidine kinase
MNGPSLGNGDSIRFLVDEQAALRRVATLVARGAPPEQVFDAVCEQMGRLVDASITNLAHFTPDGINATMAGWSVRGNHLPTGTQLPLEGRNINVIVRDTRAPARVDSYDEAPGPLAAALRGLGIKSEVGAPVIVDGAVWGALIAASDTSAPLPAGTEARVASFAELIATAVSNATARADLIASRTRIVHAADDARRRLARDLHDGAQQRIVSAIINLQRADECFERDPAEARRLLRSALADSNDGLSELRELAAGVHPTILTNRGLQAAAAALAQRCVVPVDVAVPADRYPAHVEAAAYFVIAESLTNAAKHAHATHVRVIAECRDRNLVLQVRDDGRGGAHLSGGGLVGVKDRVEALGGRLSVHSPSDHGTVLLAMLPIGAQP